MSIRKKNDGESSLELLLDTMCNTFGGVMFIGISLVVLMTMLSPAIRTNRDPFEVSREKLEQMQQELDKLAQEQTAMEEILKKMENDPRRELVTELLKLEETKQKNLLDLELVEQERKVIQEERKQIRQKISAEERALQTVREERQEKEKRLQDLERKTADLKQKLSEMKQVSMSFRVMEKSSLGFYGIIVSQNRLWKVGPDVNENHEYAVHPDCQAEAIMQKNMPGFRCTPIPGKGVPILRDGTVSAEAIALLKNIPPDRVPQFSIAKDSMASYAKLREYMKDRHIIHGTDTDFEELKCFVFSITRDEVEYEY